VSRKGENSKLRAQMEALRGADVLVAPPK
jgi:hypothetical protein